MAKENKFMKFVWGGVGIMVFALLAIFLVSYFAGTGFTPTTGTAVTGGTPVTGATSTAGQVSLLCPTTPTMTFNAKDAYANTIVSTSTSTAYYKTDGNAVTTSAPTISDKEGYQFWLSNLSYYVLPKSFVGKCSDNPIQTWAYANSSSASAPSLTLFDNIAQAAISGSTVNVSNTGTPSVTFKYAGLSYKPAMPFGGVVAFDYNRSIVGISCSSSDVELVPLGQTTTDPATGKPVAFHLTSHGTSATTYQTAYYQIGVSIDPVTGKITRGIDDGSGDIRSITCKFTNNGAAIGAIGAVNATFFPANYYATDSGEIALDTETALNANSRNSLTGKGQFTKGFNWQG